jgi:magnesium chelatase subunit D
MSDAALRLPPLSADACLAALLLAVDPDGLGGITVAARAGPQRDAWMAFLNARLPEEERPRRLPVGIADDRLLGGLDLAATLSAGRPVVQRGALAEADGGTIVIPMAERLERSAAAKIGLAMDAGEVVLERDGMTARHPARFALILLDERVEDEDPPPGGLRDRLAFAAALEPGCADEAGLFEDLDMQTVLDARGRLPTVVMPDAEREALVAAGIAFGTVSARTLWQADRAARAAAALDGRKTVGQGDVTVAARLVIAHRATRLPPSEAESGEAEAPPEEPPPPPEESEADPPEPDPEDQQQPLDPEALQDLVVAAAQAAIPGNLLAQLSKGLKPARGGMTGRAGAMRKGYGRGRPIGTRRGMPKPGQRLHVLETLRAAAPWQKLRRDPHAAPASGRPVEIRRDDFRVRRVKQHAETVTIFVVDASGSAALNRLAEAKGAVELLLADCYVRRDSVALITFAGTEAEIALPPTRSLVRAKRELTGLPGGGGTPLGRAIDTAGEMAMAIRRKGQTPTLIFMTDGKANISRDGSQGRGPAREDSMQAARAFAAHGIAAMLVDIAPRPQATARELAEAMGARYLPLPAADSGRLSAAVRQTG